MDTDKKTNYRWISIGRVRADCDLFGWPWRGGQKGWHLNWVGRVIWCQPCQFAEVEDLFAAIRMRLSMAGLEALAYQSRLPRCEYQAIWVLVRRRMTLG